MAGRYRETLDISVISELCNFDPGSLRVGKKCRGRKRRLQQALREAEAFRIEPTSESWWNLWHRHLENSGHRRWRYRLESIKGLSLMFRTIAQAKERFHTPFQLWIKLSGKDPYGDSVYLHTPNPHTEFPIRVKADWNDSRLLPLFHEMLPDYELRIGHARSFDVWADPPRTTSRFFVYSPHIGVPLE